MILSEVFKILTATPVKKRQKRLRIKPQFPEIYLVITADRITAMGRNAPNKVARSRSSGYQNPLFLWERIITMSEIHPDSGAPTNHIEMSFTDYVVHARPINIPALPMPHGKKQAPMTVSFVIPYFLPYFRMSQALSSIS